MGEGDRGGCAEDRGCAPRLGVPGRDLRGSGRPPRAVRGPIFLRALASGPAPASSRPPRRARIRRSLQRGVQDRRRTALGPGPRLRSRRTAAGRTVTALVSGRAGGGWSARADPRRARARFRLLPGRDTASPRHLPGLLAPRNGLGRGSRTRVPGGHRRPCRRGSCLSGERLRGLRCLLRLLRPGGAGRPSLAEAPAEFTDDVRGVHQHLVVDSEDRDSPMPGEPYHLFPTIAVGVDLLVGEVQPVELLFYPPTVRAVIAGVKRYPCLPCLRLYHKSSFWFDVPWRSSLRSDRTDYSGLPAGGVKAILSAYPVRHVQNRRTASYKAHESGR